MSVHVLLIAAVAWSISTAPAENDPIKKEMKKFQGRWVPVYVEKDGKPIPKEGLEDLKEIEVIIEGNRVILKEEGKVKEGWSLSFKIDPARAPKTIDLTMSIDDARPKTSLGIYKIEGDTLKISIIEPKKEPERATDFVTKPGSNNLLWHFKRK